LDRQVEIQNQNKVTNPLLNAYLLATSQGSRVAMHEKLDISSDYTFTGDIFGTINVMADNIVIDGKGYTLHGSENSHGFHLMDRKNVIIKNVRVEGCLAAFHLFSCSNIKILDNIAINNTFVGFEMYYSSHSTLQGNIATNNDHFGFCWCQVRTILFGVT